MAALRPMTKADIPLMLAPIPAIVLAFWLCNLVPGRAQVIIAATLVGVIAVCAVAVVWRGLRSRRRSRAAAAVRIPEDVAVRLRGTRDASGSAEAARAAKALYPRLSASEALSIVRRL